ncbi:MAG: VacJ family lipoprotein [Bdellovibrionales bacterium]|nr:VacJ family lipoprotein [Bdellovibrionales bacterium]
MRSQLRLSRLLLHFCLLCGLAASVLAQTPEEVSDPWEGFNRGVFTFNDTVDVYLLEPIAKGYDFIMPRPVQRSVGNFFDNLRYPVLLISDVAQLKFGQAGNHTVRFLINSTVGIGGLFDPAAPMGFEPHYEDLGTALAYHGVGPGPYLVLPLLGPSTVRDAVGRIGGFFLDPTYYFTVYGIDRETAMWLSTGLTALEVINTRADLLDAVRTAKSASLDYYGFLRKTYYQVRYEEIHDKPYPEEEFEEEGLELDEFGDPIEPDSTAEDNGAEGKGAAEEVVGESETP